MTDERTLFVGNLHEEVTNEILYELCLQAGPVTNVNIPVDRVSKKKKSFAFVLFDHEVSVPYAIHMLDGLKVFGKSIRCQHRASTDVSHFTNVGIHNIDCEKTLKQMLDGDEDIESDGSDHESNANVKRMKGTNKHFVPKAQDPRSNWKNRLDYVEKKGPGRGIAAAMGAAGNMTPMRNAYAKLMQPGPQSYSTPYNNAKYGTHDLRSQLDSGMMAPIGTNDRYRSAQSSFNYSSPEGSSGYRSSGSYSGSNYNNSNGYNGNSRYENSSGNNGGGYNNSSGYGYNSNSGYNNRGGYYNNNNNYNDSYNQSSGYGGQKRKNDQRNNRGRYYN